MLHETINSQTQWDTNFNLRRPIREMYCERICYKMRLAHVETRYTNSPMTPPLLLPHVTQTNVDAFPAWALPSLCTLCSIVLLSTPPSVLDLNYSL